MCVWVCYNLKLFVVNLLTFLMCPPMKFLILFLNIFKLSKIPTVKRSANNYGDDQIQKRSSMMLKMKEIPLSLKIELLNKNRKGDTMINVFVFKSSSLQRLQCLWLWKISWCNEEIVLTKWNLYCSATIQLNFR